MTSLGYKWICQKKMKGKKRIRRWTAVWTAVLFCYVFVVLSATFLGRGNAWYARSCVMVPFWSYRSAWYTMEAMSWREIVLNICMFVPFGFFLPVAYKRCRKAWVSYLAGVGFTLFIETMQLITGKGIFAVDDLLNNTVGAMIGYGFYMIVSDVARRVCKRIKRKAAGKDNAKSISKKEHGWLSTLCCQIPFAITLLGFAVLYMIYQGQEFGNLACHYVLKEDLNDTDISVQTVFSEEKATGMVYQIGTFDREELDKRAEQMFAAIGTKMEEAGRKEVEGGSIAYTDQSGNYRIWLDYAGGTYTFTDSSQLQEENGTQIAGQPDATRTMIVNALAEIGIEAPGNCAFEDLGEGQYRFIADQICEGNVIYDGTMVCEYNVNGKVGRVHNNIRECREYKEVSLRSEKDVYNDLTEGKFSRGYYVLDKIETMELKDISIAYLRDSKNYYQPVYEVEATVNGEEMVIDLPALDE